MRQFPTRYAHPVLNLVWHKDVVQTVYFLRNAWENIVTKLIYRHAKNFAVISVNSCCRHCRHSLDTIFVTDPAVQVLYPGRIKELVDKDFIQPAHCMRLSPFFVHFHYKNLDTCIIVHMAQITVVIANNYNDIRIVLSVFKSSTLLNRNRTSL